MDNFLQRSAGLYKNPWPLLLVTLAITVFFALGMPKLTIDNDVKSMLPANEPTRMLTELYDSEANFGSSNGALIAIEAQDIFSLDTLTYIKKVTDELSTLNKTLPVRQLAQVLNLSEAEAQRVLDDLHSVGINDLNYPTQMVDLLRTPDATVKKFAWDQALANKVAQAASAVDPAKLFAVYDTPLGLIQSLVTADFITAEDDALVAQKLIANQNPTPESIVGLKERVQSWDTYEGTLVAKDLSMTAVTVMLKTKDADVKAMFNTDLVQIIANPPAGIRVSISGEPVILDHLAAMMAQDMPTLIPLMILVLILILFFCFRTLQGILYPLFLTVLAAIWTFGLMGYLGVPLTVIGSMIPILLMAIVSAYGIHQMNHYYEDPQTGKFAVLRHNAKSVGLAILLSGLTVMIGFGSMVVLDFVPIRNFGVFTAIGDLVGVLAALYVLPALLMLGKPLKKPRKVVTEAEKQDLVARLLHATKNFGRQHPGRVLVLMGVGGIALASGSFFVKSDMDSIKFFPAHDTIRVADKLMNERMAGTKSLSVIFDSDTRDPMTRQGNPDTLLGVVTPEVLKKMDQYATDVKARFPQVRKVSSYADVLKKMNQVMNGGDSHFYVIPDDPALIAEYLVIFSGDTKALLTPNQDKMRLMVTMNSGSLEDSHAISLFTKAYFDQSFLAKNHLALHLTGEQEISYMANQVLLSGNLESITACLIIVFVLLLVVLRNLPMTLVAIVPIVLCLAVNFGYLGFSGTELNTTTSLVSSIGIGIGIDFSIHFITWYRRELMVDRNISAAVDRTILRKGRAILYNLFVIVGGFLVLVGSSMGPMKDFGLLTALCLTVTAFGALVVVPALIRFLAKKDYAFLYLGVKEPNPTAFDND